MLTRRDFIQKLALVTAGAMALEKLELLDRLAPRSLFSAWPGMPTLWGDGIQDDTAALQTMMNGRAVYLHRSRKIYNGQTFVSLPSGKYRITDTLHVPYPGELVDGGGSILLADRLPEGAAALHIHTERDLEMPRVISNWWVDSRPRQARAGIEYTNTGLVLGRM